MDIGAFVKTHKTEVYGAAAGVGLAGLYALVKGRKKAQTPAQYLTPDVLASSPSGEIITITGSQPVGGSTVTTPSPVVTPPGSTPSSGGSGGTITADAPTPIATVAPVAPAPPPPPPEAPAPPPAPVLAPAPQALSISAPILASVSPPAPIPGVPNWAAPVLDPIIGDTSSVVVGETGDSPFVYGGSDAQAQSLLQQLGPPPAPVPFPILLQPGATLGPATGAGQQYVTSDGTSFTFG